jgi:predicted DNA binding protein
MRNGSSKSLIDGLDLRYMQVEISAESTINLPGRFLINSFQSLEFITLIKKDKDGMLCYAKLVFDDPKVLTQNTSVFEIVEIKSQTKNSALAILNLRGPIPMMFHDDEEVWWVNPTFLQGSGMTLTVRGTKGGLKRTRDKLSLLIGNGFTVKLGTESPHGPEYRDLLPEKQRLVLDKAIEMGYYSRPRGCTQRDIAQVMDIKQATVSEHLQSAESKIIHSLSNNVG